MGRTARVATSLMVRTIRMASQQKQEYPDDVDEVPVESRDLDRVVPGGREAAARRHHGDHPHHPDTDREMYRVHAGHGEVEPEEEPERGRFRTGREEAEAGHEP